MFGFTEGELIGLGLIFVTVGYALWWALRNTKGPGGPDRWGR